MVDEGQVQELTNPLELDLKSGEHTITLLVTRENEPLQNSGISVEIVDGAVTVK